MSDDQHEDDQHAPESGDAQQQSAHSEQPKRPRRAQPRPPVHDQARHLKAMDAERDRVARSLQERDRISDIIEQQNRASEMLRQPDRLSEILEGLHAAGAHERRLEDMMPRSAYTTREFDVARDMIALAERTRSIEEDLVRSSSFMAVRDTLADAMVRSAALDDILSAKLRSIFEDTSGVDFTSAGLKGAADLFSSANAARAVFDFGAATLFTSERLTRTDFIGDLLQRLSASTPDVRELAETRNFEDLWSDLDPNAAGIAEGWDQTLTTALAGMLTEVDVAEVMRRPAGTAAPGDGAADADALAVVAVKLWRDVLARLPHLSETMRVGLLTIIVTILIAVVTTLHADRSAARADAERATEHRETLQAIEGVREATREHHVVALRPLPLRDDADAKARRKGTIAAGTHLVVLERVGRWLYVTPVGETSGGAVGAAGTGETAGDPPGSGWVYYRHIRPLDAAQ